ncbi:hypothetical protein WKI68_13080 [Streptomyces sp. MS1.HAVA.3]|uniref:Uncharacterized protein n=1 Tax=Streptomyces caledonius TaxID=3134107 RepID=A0ABU8U4P1_9ACTN
MPTRSVTPTIPSPPSVRHSATARVRASVRAAYIDCTVCEEDDTRIEEDHSAPQVPAHWPGLFQEDRLKTAVPNTCPTGSNPTPLTAANSSEDSVEFQVPRTSGGPVSRPCVIGSRAIDLSTHY